MKMKMRIPAPQQQIDFSFALAQIRSLFLQDALLETIEHLDIARVDHELNAIVPKQSLKSLARQGMRGELVFPVPCLLQANPRLLGYYRLLLGFSQKGFYATETGVSRFKGMEDKGILSRGNEALLPELCAALIQPLAFLIAGIGPDRISREFLDDLTLLTVGPQLKGGANNKIGIAGTVKVFEIIHDIVRHASVSSTAKEIEILNAAGRKVLIEFASDPDIIIREQMDVDSLRNIIAIEIKAGTDFSNIHNRIGEAEKSHQKARSVGYHECWTVVNVDRIDIAMAQRESPSTNRFYGLSRLMANGDDEEYRDFRNRIISLTGIIRNPEVLG